MTMFRTAYFSIALVMSMLLAIGPVKAEQVGPEILTMHGTVQYIDNSNHQLVVDDRTLNVARDVVVISQYGKATNLSALYPGKQIRMLVEYPPEGSAAGTIRKIELLR